VSLCGSERITLPSGPLKTFLTECETFLAADASLEFRRCTDARESREADAGPCKTLEPLGATLFIFIAGVADVSNGSASSFVRSVEAVAASAPRSAISSVGIDITGADDSWASGSCDEMGASDCNSCASPACKGPDFGTGVEDDGSCDMTLSSLIGTVATISGSVCDSRVASLRWGVDFGLGMGEGGSKGKGPGVSTLVAAGSGSGTVSAFGARAGEEGF